MIRAEALETADRIILVGWWTWGGICALALVLVLVHALQQPSDRAGRGRYRMSAARGRGPFVVSPAGRPDSGDPARLFPRAGGVSTDGPS